MKVAVPIWASRVSPVLDVARQLRVLQVDGGEIVSQADRHVAGADRAAGLLALGADVLICAAVSRQLEQRLAAGGVEVIAEICGSVDEVIAAFLDGRLGDAGFAMPGCCGRRRHARGRCGQGRREDHLKRT